MNVVCFPRPFRSRVEVTGGIDNANGKTIYLVELIEGEGRCILASCSDVPVLARTAAELLADGLDVVWGAP